MDREANLPVPQAKNLVRSILNQDTSSSSSSSSPELLRHVQAAFKRHRPLSKMQTSTIGPRRSVASQREASRSLGLNVAPKADVKRSHDIVSLDQSHTVKNLTQDTRNTSTSVVGESYEDASITPPSFSGTITKTFGENFNHFGRQIDQSKPAISCKENYLHIESQYVGGLRNVQSPASNIFTSQGMEWDASNQAEVSKLVANNESRLSQTVESEISLKSDCLVSSSLAKIEGQLHQFKNFLNKPATQCSVVGSSCATTTSIHSASAPMLNATTYVPRSYGESNNNLVRETLADPNANPQAVPDRGDVMRSQYPSHKDTSFMQVDQKVITAHVLDSAIDTGVEAKELDQSKNKQGISESEVPIVSSGDKNDVQSEVPLSKDGPPNVMPQPSNPEKQEKTASGKRTSGARKRNYDPDLFFKVNGKLYQRLGKIGSGGSSEVHKVISSDCSIYALKKIKLKGRDYATAYGFCQEIEYLNKLRGKNNIIQLIDYEVTDKTLLWEVMNGTMNNKDGRVKDDGYIYMVLEYGEIDLAHMLSQKWKEIDGSDQLIDENWLRFYWQQILQAVNTIHEERIVHSDLKPANFLLVKGFLKLIDFGIAKAIMSDTTNIQRDSQVGTLSYMSPEAFMCNESDENGNTIKCGRPSDIWSLGCILYQMVYGRTPFAEYKSFWAKFKVITDPNHEVGYGPVSNPWLLDLMKKCLAWDRNKRWRIPQLLHHPFLVPPIPQPPQDRSCKLLQVIAESCNADQDASSLISQLEQLLTDPVEVTSDLSASRDQQCKLLLSRVSKLCVQLQERLGKSERE